MRALTYLVMLVIIGGLTIAGAQIMGNAIADSLNGSANLIEEVQ